MRKRSLRSLNAGPAALAAMSTLARLGCRNVHVRHDSGTDGWLEEAPFDAIVVNARARHVPRVLKDQLAAGGRLVMTLGDDPEAGELVRVTRGAGDEFRVEDMADIGAELVLGEPPHVSVHAGALWRMPAGPANGKGTAAADAALARQFDEYIWFDETRAVTPLPTKVREGLADTYPFGV